MSQRLLAVFALSAPLLFGCGGGDQADAGTRLLCATCTTSTESTPAPSPVVSGPGAGGSAGLEGYWNGSSGGYTFSVLTLSDGSAFTAYLRGGAIEGVMLGSVAAANGTFSGSLTDYNGRLLSVTPGSISGTYAERSSMSGVARVGSLTYSFTAAYDPTYDTPVDMAQLAGTWTGTSGSRDGVTTTRFTIDQGGGISGATPFCAGAGTLTPVSAGKHPLRITLNFSGASCPLAGRAVTGLAIAAQSGGAWALVAAGVLPDGSDGFFAVASK